VTHDDDVAEQRSPSQGTIREAAAGLRRLLDAIDAGDLDAITPGEVALLRRLQGTLVGWEEALRVRPPSTDHAP
jgi:hypothetical protein